ncbi:MAG: RrF2 family transcriptional regulator [Hyphomicrobium sp.]
MKQAIKGASAPQSELARLAHMRLTKQTGHAIRILLDCAQSDGGLLKVADISARLGITKQNVFKIVHILSRAGFVAAVRGPSGGVRLARPAAAIKVGDVVRAIEVTRVRVDTSAKAAPRGEQSPLNTVFDDALGAFIAVLDQHTLAELSNASAGMPGGAPARKRAAPTKRAADIQGGLRRTTSRRA